MAEDLSVPFEAITTVISGDTNHTPDGVGMPSADSRIAPTAMLKLRSRLEKSVEQIFSCGW